LIFKLRGGLGNQLFQIAGVAKIAKKLKLVVIFSDADVRLNPRDSKGAAAFLFRIENFFDNPKAVYQTGKVLEVIIRIYPRLHKSINCIQEIDGDKGFSDLTLLINIMQGYLQNRESISGISASMLKNVFQNSGIRLEAPEIIALHIRGKDGLLLKSMKLSYDYYARALQALEANQETEIHVYSDDLEFARKLCSKIESLHFEFMETDFHLSAREFILKLSSYSKIVSSKSTLCWWAAAFATAINPSSLIISPWGDELSLDNWVQLIAIDTERG
jgi:hypothetical protein